MPWEMSPTMVGRRRKFWLQTLQNSYFNNFRNPNIPVMWHSCTLYWLNLSLVIPISKERKKLTCRSAGINLDKNSVWLSDPVPLYKNYTNLYFDAKRLKRGWKTCGGWGDFVVSFFFKESALFGKYRMLLWYSRLGPGTCYLVNPKHDSKLLSQRCISYLNFYVRGIFTNPCEHVDGHWALGLDKESKVRLREKMIFEISKNLPNKNTIPD